jgi:transglutaminase-like putative cysteine protease/Flp pilus assembly protein TadD
MSRLLALALTLGAALPAAAAADGPLVAAPPARTDSPEDPALVRLQENARAAAALSDSPRGLAPLLRLHAERDEVADLQGLAAAYQAVLDKTSTHPRVRPWATVLLADVERARGRGVRAREALAPLAFLGSFRVLGGFDNEGKGGCDTDFGPESHLDLAATYGAAGRELRWHALPVRPADGFVDLGAAVHPRTDVVAYALTFLEAERDTQVALWLGASGAHRLWVNGERVSAGDRYHPAALDQAGVSVRLRKGINRVMLKVCHAGGPLGFALRQERVAGGGPLAREVSPESLPPVPLAPKEKAPRGPHATPLQGVASLLEALLRASPGDAQLRADLATVVAGTATYDETSPEDATLSQQAADAAPEDVALQLLAADRQRDDFNTRRALLDRALAAAPDHPGAVAALGAHLLQRDQPWQALTLLGPHVERHPGHARARLLHAQALDRTGQHAAAENALTALWRERPQHPAVVRELAQSLRARERRRESLELLRVALGLRDDDGAARRALAAQLAESAQPHEAAEQLLTHLSLQPFDNAARLQLAELLVAAGEGAAATTRFAEARALSPDDPEVHEREGRARLSAGDREGGARALERALALRPQDATLREALRALRGTGTDAASARALPLGPLLEEAKALSGEDAVQLVEYQHVRVQPSGMASLFRQVAYRVLTPRGADALREFAISWSPGRQELRVLRARAQKPDGALVESFGESERNLNEPWTGMYYDARARVLAFPELAPGDILEVQYRLDDTAADNLLSDYWGEVDYVQGMAPRLRYLFEVEMPPGRPLYWNEGGVKGLTARQETLPDGGTRYAFSASNVPRLLSEPGMPGPAESASPLHLSTYADWDAVGRYYWSLVREQLLPTDELRRTVDEALSGVDRADVRAVVQALYGFVVTQTRYVALEFGIHGYKPYRVDRVLARRFGDCKDKASLMHALLKVAGVDSRLVLLRMRHLGDIGAGPASLAAFNHAILYVPSLDLFLDGTAEYHGLKELPSADRLANVLVVEPEGGSRYLVVPPAPAEDNATALEVEASLRPDGSAQLKGATRVVGQEAPQFRRGYQAQATQRPQFEQAWAASFPGARVESLQLSGLQDLGGGVGADFTLAVPRFAEVLEGGLRFFPLGTGRAFVQAFAPLAERRHDLLLSDPFLNRLTFRVQLPPGYRVEELPPAFRDEGPFGRAGLAVAPDGEGGLQVTAELALTTARVRAADYPAFRAWLQRVDQAFNRRLTARRVAGQMARAEAPTPASPRAPGSPSLAR